MAIIAEMTQLSPTMSEGTIVNWIKKEGESISPGDIIAEVETDKAVMEMEAYDEGTILAILAGDGQKVAVGLPIAILGEEGEDITDLKKEAEEKLKNGKPQGSGSGSESDASADTGSNPSGESSKPSSSPNKNSDGSDSKTKKENQDQANEAEDSDGNGTQEKKSSLDSRKDSESNQSQKSTVRTEPNTERILASPLAKSIAIQKSVDLKYVKGTGPGGRILQRDVYSFIDSRGSKNSRSENNARTATSLNLRPVPEEKNIPVSGMRKTIAERLTSSKNNLPHFYLNRELDAEPLTTYREIINTSLERMAGDLEEGERPPKVSLNDIIIKATALALEKHPNVNASWQGDTIRHHGRIDIGVAVAIEDGLITPVLRNANSMGLVSISNEVRRLAGLAKKRKLKPEEFTGSSFTISNLGMFGIRFFTAIINEPEAAILAVGAVEDKPVIKNGEIVPGKTMEITLSCDHRVVDGAEGAKFLLTLGEYLENPELLAI